jgi:DNA polymerase III subunit epsilon
VRNGNNLATMREIVLDTETTGLDPLQGDRIVEIGCIELFNRIPTGKTFHRYVNPEREMPASAGAIHGLSTEFLQHKPVFATIADEFLDFLKDSALVIHNAGFDLAFINAELVRAAKPLLTPERLVDTLLLARRKHPGGPNRLDDLCARYGIDNSRRTKHGALLDAEILAELYVDLVGARQAQLGLQGSSNGANGARARPLTVVPRPVPLAVRVTAAERAAHRAFVATLGANAIWLDYLALDAGSAPRNERLSESRFEVPAVLLRARERSSNAKN